MSDAHETHVGDQRLQQFADGELDGAAAETVRRHADSCPECARRVEEIRRAADAYLEIHRAMRAADPVPPSGWADIRPMLAARRDGRRWWTWAAAAAVIVLAAAGLSYRLTRPATVSAAELLRKAAAIEVWQRPPRRIRVRSMKGMTVRPAVVTADASGEIAALFLAAHFSWQDPFSARSFADWRARLPEKRDSVRQSEDRYEIETTTASSGPLESATLVLDARDLHPVRETLRFTTDRVEITEAEPETAPVKPVQPAAPPRRDAPAEAGATAELKALAALRRIDADLGEPVRVVREGGSVVVAASGLTPVRERQVRDAVEGISGVVYRSEDVDAMIDAPPPRRTAPRQETPGRLAGRLGEDGVNRILDASDAVMARVYALRGLSRRFPQAREAELADADRDVLARLRGEHVSGIRRSLDGLRAAIAPLLANRTVLAEAQLGPWQDRAERTFAAARAMDQLLTRALAAGGEEPDSADLTSALAHFEAQVSVEERQ